MPFRHWNPRMVIRRNHETNPKSKRYCGGGIIVKGLFVGFLLLFLVWNYRMGTSFTSISQQEQERSKNIDLNRRVLLRKYPPHRYYKLNSIPRNKQPAFLTTETEYIFGEWPIVLPLSNKKDQGPFKVVVDQSSWWSPPASSKNLVLPFADGTNPSIISIDRLLGWEQLPGLLQSYPGARFLATACMTNSQCAWNDSPTEMQQYQINPQTKPDTIRTVLLIFNESFQTLGETTLYLERDAGWGRKLRQPGPLHLPALDDARLFRHDRQLFVSYREGPGFGYETQVLNPIHLEFSATASTGWSAHIRASETSSFCCGRNMALMKGDSDSQLRALTWVDPVTIIDVDSTPGATNKPRRQLAEQQQGKKKHKSHIHGTNGFMVEIPSSSSKNNDDHVTFLGVAHFHRPNDRNENPYARFGHHYTHAFYTVRKGQLVGLSPEFVLPSKYDEKDGEVIQFLSGLEYDARRNQVIIAYGINDCEAAVQVVDLYVVQTLLRPVIDGKQVVDFMMPLTS